MMKFFFADPFFLYYLFFIPSILALFFISFYLRRMRAKRFLSESVFSRLIPSYSFSRKIISLFLAVSSLIFIILALARPQWALQDFIEKSEGIEVMILADISRSMLAQDVRPNRLTLLKTQLGQFVDLSKKNHRMGLIAFAGSSFLLSPLTSDLNLIQLYLNSLSTDMISSQGTNMKLALLQALKSFEGGGIPTATKALIIASDGENHEVGALEQIRKISQEGIHIFTLGFGTKKGAPIILENKKYQKDFHGNIIHSQFKGHILREYAKIGKGAFYHVRSNSDFAKKLHGDLIDLDQHVFEKKKSKAQDEKFQYFLLFALAFSWAYWLFSERVPKKK